MNLAHAIACKLVHELVPKVDTHEFYSNRDSQKLPYNPWSYIVRFCDDSGKVIVDILNFLCHPTVLHAENIAVSTDLIGGIRKAYNQPLMILLGECGDVSTRFTRKESSFAEVARLSQKISEQLKNGTWQALSGDELSVQTLVFDNTYHPSEDQFLLKSQQKLQLLVQQDKNCQPLLERLTNRLKQSTQTMHLQATIVKLGELAMIFLPCEIVYALGKELREVKDKVLVVGYTNGFLGYAVNQDAYEQIAESLISEIPYGQADKIFHALAQTLLKLK
ncbi:hypothetical protein FC14_GL000991 [Ligilactobacillus agilis DSM 20509]|uniref:Uncharacterized protein n=1 Tax=Ligilactobacillus agilis DSM 20509 TaxID=1423718 RepID=A0A0R2A7T0_9LACO|nr:hypothetical protein [Ligilactobacillus agilis]KRM63165.1 hypothetical protein FC14_GL000991 [Ligilactobacillus agilis DSM 20509]